MSEDDVQAMHDAVVQGSVRPEQVVHRHNFTLSAEPFWLAIYDDARIVRVAHKHGETSATADVWEVHRTDTIRPAVLPRRWFVVRGTGHPIDGEARHVATWNEGPFWWHLFEVPPPSRA